ncbi:hypothetical protein AB7W42_21515 [Providencia rettgeri]
MKGSSGITNTGIIHREVDNFIFGTGLADAIFIIPLEDSVTILATKPLVSSMP